MKWIRKDMLKPKYRQKLQRKEKYMRLPKIQPGKYVIQEHIRGVGYRKNDRPEVKVDGEKTHKEIQTLLQNDFLDEHKVEFYVYSEDDLLHTTGFTDADVIDEWQKIQKIKDYGEFKDKGEPGGEEKAQESDKFHLYDLVTEDCEACSILGSSAHLDFRWQMNEETANGLTLMDSGRTGDPWSINNKPGMGGEKILCEEKATEPIGWLKAAGKNVGDLSEVKPGAVGATRYGLAYFINMDLGEYWMGAQKSLYLEWELHGERFDGRWNARMLKLPKTSPETKEPIPGEYIYHRNFWKPEDQSFYVCGERPIKKGWIPPDGWMPVSPNQIEEYTDDFLKYFKWAVENDWKSELGD